jgi:hypothetical protein
VLRIVYGLLTAPLSDERVDYAGCDVTPDAPRFRCAACGTTWQ